MTSAERSFLEIQNELERIIKKEQSQIIRTYASAYREILKKIKGIYAKYGKDGVISNADKTMLNRLLSIEKQCVAILKEKHAAVEDLVNERARFAYGESFFKGCWYIDNTYELNTDWGLMPVNAVEAAVEHGFELVASSKTFQAALNPSIGTLHEIFTQGLIEGLSIDKIADMLIKRLGVTAVSAGVTKFVGGGIAGWARMVARTEIHRAMSLGQLKTEERAKEAGLETEWIWLATLDGRTRPEHGALDGQKKQKEGWYVPSIGFVQGPGLSGVARFDINCRCTTIASVMGMMPKTRYEEGKVVPWKTYEEWLKEQPVGAAPNIKLNINKSSKEGKGSRKLRKDIVTSHSSNSDIESNNTLNKKALREGKVNFTTDGLLDGHPRAFCRGNTINIPNGILGTDYSRQVIPHEIRHFLENTAEKTDKLIEAREAFERSVTRTMKAINENDSRWEIIANLAEEHPDNSNLSDLISLITKNRIHGFYLHDDSEVNILTSLSKEISADLHGLATVDKALYKSVQDVFDDLTDAFETYTIILTGGA